MVASKFFRLIPIRSTQAKEEGNNPPKLKERKKRMKNLIFSSFFFLLFSPFYFLFYTTAFAFVAFCIVVSEFSSVILPKIKIKKNNVKLGLQM